MVGGTAFLGMSFLGGASAQESPWTLRAGPAGVFWDQSSKVTVAGSGVPGAEINLNNNYTLGLDIGYDLSDRWTACVSFHPPQSSGCPRRPRIPILKEIEECSEK